MSISRRLFMQRAGAVGLGFAGLHALLRPGRTWAASRPFAPRGVGYGPLRRDPAGLIDLPAGFSYAVFSSRGDEMDDGLLVPGRHDGMAAFPGPRGTTILVRNHENETELRRHSPFGPSNERLARIDRRALFDAGHGRTPAIGGTTTLVYDTQNQKLVRHFLSLVGTNRNCAGGPTPWGTWLSCEEDTTTAADPSRLYEQDHGWVFEVPASAEPVLEPPRPIRPMGRFRHEAVAVDPATGIVYQTEDLADGLIYRYMPRERGKLSAGGRLQALSARGSPRRDTSNWEGSPATPVGHVFEAEWVELDDVLAPLDDLRTRGAAAGAATFARSEGMWYGAGHAGGPGAIYWVPTAGGRNKLGQIWRYTPGPHEGTDREREAPGRFELFLEPEDAAVLRNADNITFAPWGDMILCEDNGQENRLLGVTPGGEVYALARNARDKSEFAGATFSPDGSTLFVNIQEPGCTLAVRGSWR